MFEPQTSETYISVCATTEVTAARMLIKQKVSFIVRINGKVDENDLWKER